MASATSSDPVLKLYNQYTRGSIYAGTRFVSFTKNRTINRGFMGSSNVVILCSENSIVHEAPACIAAPIVNMVAKNIISIGMAGQGRNPVPARLYAPEMLTITTQHLSIGELMLLTEPKNALLSCKKLTLSKSKEEEPDYFEVVRSWAINDDMKIEVVTNNKMKSEVDAKK